MPRQPNARRHFASAWKAALQEVDEGTACARAGVRRKCAINADLRSELRPAARKGAPQWIRHAKTPCHLQRVARRFEEDKANGIVRHMSRSSCQNSHMNHDVKRAKQGMQPICDARDDRWTTRPTKRLSAWVAGPNSRRGALAVRLFSRQIRGQGVLVERCGR